jgi:hypothetical protein
VARLGAITMVILYSLAMTGCGEAEIQCRGSVTELTTSGLPDHQYGNVTCVTQGLDREVTRGGE